MKSERFSKLPDKEVFSVFFTAGFPRLNDTRSVLRELQRADVAMVEIGFPFSDPTADGPTIQQSSFQAIQNGMTVAKLFEQLATVREEIHLPLLLMGYLNPMLQYGVESFLRACSQCGVDALIVPDLPFEEYRSTFSKLYRHFGIAPVFLVTARTPEERIRQFDAEEPAFLYVVSSEATTGGKAQVTEERSAFFARLKGMNLNSPLIVGFGVADRESFQAVTRHTRGAIVGSAFVRAIQHVEQGATPFESDPVDLSRKVAHFIKLFNQVPA